MPKHRRSHTGLAAAPAAAVLGVVASLAAAPATAFAVMDGESTKSQSSHRADERLARDGERDETRRDRQEGESRDRTDVEAGVGAGSDDTEEQSETTATAGGAQSTDREDQSRADGRSSGGMHVRGDADTRRDLCLEEHEGEVSAHVRADHHLFDGEDDADDGSGSALAEGEYAGAENGHASDDGNVHIHLPWVHLTLPLNAEGHVHGPSHGDGEDSDGPELVGRGVLTAGAQDRKSVV